MRNYTNGQNGGARIAAVLTVPLVFGATQGTVPAERYSTPQVRIYTDSMQANRRNNPVISWTLRPSKNFRPLPRSNGYKEVSESETPIESLLKELDRRIPFASNEFFNYDRKFFYNYSDGKLVKLLSEAEEKGYLGQAINRFSEGFLPGQAYSSLENLTRICGEMGFESIYLWGRDKLNSEIEFLPVILTSNPQDYSDKIFSQLVRHASEQGALHKVVRELRYLERSGQYKVQSKIALGRIRKVCSEVGISMPKGIRYRRVRGGEKIRQTAILSKVNDVDFREYDVFVADCGERMLKYRKKGKERSPTYRNQEERNNMRYNRGDFRRQIQLGELIYNETSLPLEGDWNESS